MYKGGWQRDCILETRFWSIGTSIAKSSTRVQIVKNWEDATIDQPPESQGGSPRGQAILPGDATIIIATAYVRQLPWPHYRSNADCTPTES